MVSNNNGEEEKENSDQTKSKPEGAQTKSDPEGVYQSNISLALYVYNGCHFTPVDTALNIPVKCHEQRDLHTQTHFYHGKPNVKVEIQDEQKRKKTHTYKLNRIECV